MVCLRKTSDFVLAMCIRSLCVVSYTFDCVGHLTVITAFVYTVISIPEAIYSLQSLKAGGTPLG